MLDVTHELVEHVGWLLRERRRVRSTRRRRLGRFEHALLTLVHPRKNETSSQPGSGFGISQATAWRYVDETLDVLAGWAPGLYEALTGLGEGDHVIVQACPTGQTLALADRAYQGAGATVRTPYKNRPEHPEHYQQLNRDHARLRAPGERAFAQLKSWRILRRTRCSTRRTGNIAQTVHTLLTCNCSG